METTADRAVLLSVDGLPLKVSLARALRRRKAVAIGLTLPLLTYILFTFVIPIGQLLFLSVDSPELSRVLPKTTALLSQWDKQKLPEEPLFASFFAEFAAAVEKKEHGEIGKRLNYEESGMRSLINKTARRLHEVKGGPYREALIRIDQRWGSLDTWKIIALASAPITPTFYLAALDLQLDVDGNIERAPEYRRIYLPVFWRTLGISLAVTVITLLLAFPIAHLLATLPLKHSNLLMILVLLPFWTSLLVRTTSWIVLLQSEGVVNDILLWLGVLDRPVQMIYNLNGTLVAMSHILLPFMVLPLYSVMKSIPPSLMRAAQSLGARPALAFWKVYVPQTLPGIGAGSLLVFILSIGYYITPALVGGRTGSMISNFIADHMQKTLNWGLAAALSSILLIAVLALYWLYDRLVGIDNVKLG